MIDLHSVTFEPLDADDARDLAELGRRDGTFDGLVRSAVRAQFAHAAIGQSLGRAVERGLAVAEACAMLLLAGCPAEDARGLRTKGMVLRPFLPNDAYGPMVRAALDEDARRLGICAKSVAARPSRTSARGS